MAEVDGATTTNNTAPVAPSASSSDVTGVITQPRDDAATDRVRALIDEGVTTNHDLRARLSMTTAQIGSALQSLVKSRVIVRTGRGTFAKVNDLGRSVPRPADRPAERPTGSPTVSAVAQAALVGLQDLSAASAAVPDGIAALERRIVVARAELSGLEQALRLVRGLGLIDIDDE
jgi:hypothetical protein